MPRIRRLDIDDLLILRVLLSGGTFHDAGCSLFISQPAVSQRMRKMEWVFGEISLTYKDGRKMKLTEHGITVAVKADETLKRLEQT